jgi:hypothetical protein
VLAVSSVLVVLVPSMIAQFSYRYGLPLLVLLPPAGAAAADIGLDALLARRAYGRRWHRGPQSKQAEASAGTAVQVGAASPGGDALRAGQPAAPNGDRAHERDLRSR